MLRFFEPIALVGPAWAIDMPRFIEVLIEPTPSVSRKALLETRTRAATTNRFPQTSVDVILFDVRVAGRRVRTKCRRAGWARIALVFGATYVAHSGCGVVGRFGAGPRANCTSLGSSMPHGLIRLDWHLGAGLHAFPRIDPPNADLSAPSRPATCPASASPSPASTRRHIPLWRAFRQPARLARKAMQQPRKETT